MSVNPFKVIWLSSGFYETESGIRYPTWASADAAGKAGMKQRGAGYVGYYVKG